MPSITGPKTELTDRLRAVAEAVERLPAFSFEERRALYKEVKAIATQLREMDAPPGRERPEECEAVFR